MTFRRKYADTMRLVSSSLRSSISERDSVNDLLRSLSPIAFDPCTEQIFRSEGRRRQRKTLIVDSFFVPCSSFLAPCGIRATESLQFSVVIVHLDSLKFIVIHSRRGEANIELQRSRGRLGL